MHKLEDTKYEQINNILIVVKLSALLFCAIICFKYLTVNAHRNILEQITGMSMLFVAVFLLGIYLLWSTIAIKKLGVRSEQSIQMIENIIFMIIFFIIIIISGAHESTHKFLFLFIITTTTIQSGMRYGVIIATISGGLILALDLLAVPSGVINPYFEDDIILVGIFMLTAYPLGYYVKLEREHIASLKEKLNRDELTGVYTHCFFQENLREKIKIAEETQTPVSMLFIDIDNFKYYNDINGHQKGDLALKKIGEVLNKVTRQGDIVARYGGQEFAIILPDTGVSKVVTIAEKIRQTIENIYIEGQENQPSGNLTVSIGISTYPDNAKDEVELIKSADDAVYRAKFFRKNKVEVYVSVLDELKKDLLYDEKELVTSIKTLISVINAKDKYTYGHTERVVMYSRMLAEHLNLSESDKKSLVYGAYMHDIGKINIPEQVLNKKMPLDREEWKMLKKHSEEGIAIIEPVISLNYVKPLILYHHEKFDGTGYPEGLKGEQIPFLARILTIVDSFDAMTSNRPYNKRKSYEEGLKELDRCKGTQFDPKIVEEFIEAFMTIKDELMDY